MLKTYWEQIIQGKDVRQNLSKLRQELKKPGNRTSMCSIMAGDEKVLIKLLNNEDAKIRKNAALLMGDLGNGEYLAPVYLAYKKETQRFIRSSYLTAMQNFDYREYMGELKEQLQILTNTPAVPENEKHLTEEIRSLTSMIVLMEGIPTHKFKGWNETYDVILLTNRNFAHITERELAEHDPAAQTKIFGAGVRAIVSNLNWIEEIRTYQELLFVIRDAQVCPMEPALAAEKLVKSQLLDFMTKSHKGQAPYYFRVEFKSKRPLDEKAAFVKKLSGQIEKLSQRKLINSTSNYELELRLIENKDGNCNILVKLYTLKDDRFAYRQEVIPTSIRPVNAALTAALAKDYMKEDAQVLDPFCGVGTMLIERHKAVAANTSYGIDIQGDAIEKARGNTQAARQIIHYINRDFFDFTHEYLFDEIITDMPFKIGRETEEGIYRIYERFFYAAPEYLKDHAVVILYTHNREYVQKLAPRNHFKIMEEYEISMRERTYVYVLEYHKISGASIDM